MDDPESSNLFVKKADVEEMVTNILTKILSRPEYIQIIVETITKEVINQINRTVAFETEKIHEFEGKLNNMKREKDDKIKDLESKIDDLEQYQRRSSIRIFGIGENRNEDTNAKTLKFLQEKINLNISSIDIDACHRVGKQPENPKRSRPIIVKFTRRETRDLAIKNRRKLKGTGTSIHEDLTHNRLTILKEAQQKLETSNVWTTNGNILCKINGSIRKISSQEELAKIKQQIDRN